MASEPDDALGAAYGDPAITVVCGAPVPADFDPTARCDEVNGVGWFVEPAALADPSLDVAVSTPANEPVVAAVVPADYRPDDQTDGDAVTAAVLATLAPLVRGTLRELDTCD